MEFYTYILYSQSLDIYYKGFTTNLGQRLSSHNLGENEFSSRAKDWIVVYSKLFSTKKEALIEEKRIKKLNRISILRLISG